MAIDGFICSDTAKDRNRCGNHGVTPHECPYQTEINDNHELCTCCADCERECLMDI